MNQLKKLKILYQKKNNIQIDKKWKYVYLI